MKKIFTLLVGAAMLAPMASADEVTMNLDTYNGDGNVGPNVASMKGTVTYDASEKLYSLPNFLGTPNATVQFYIGEETGDMNGTTTYGLEFLFPSEPTATDIVKKASNFKIAFAYELLPGYTDGADYTTNPIYDTGVFSGNGIKIKLSQITGIWGLNEDTPSTAVALSVKRAFAIKQGEGYKFYMRVDAAGQKMDTGSGFGEFQSYPEAKYYVSFSYPENGDSSAITEIEAADNDAPVEYFNLQGVRVDNPANGLYIRRQGNKIEKVVIR